MRIKLYYSYMTGGYYFGGEYDILSRLNSSYLCVFIVKPAFLATAYLNQKNGLYQ